MAEQTYDLTQQGAEVQAIINDANNCKGAGAQTTLTTESILLKDVNGQYHKILKSSFTEAIRDTLAGLLVNNDKGTTINQIAAIASGDFGSVTPANLASVLGGVDGFEIKYAANGTPPNIKRDASGATPALSFSNADKLLGRLFISGVDDKLYFSDENNNNYEITKQGYLNSYSDLSSLASALGGLKIINTGQNLNANDFGTGLAYCTTNCQNVPETWVLVLTLSNGNDAVQLAMGVSATFDKIYIRRKTTGTWESTWHQIPFAS